MKGDMSIKIIYKKLPRIKLIQYKLLYSFLSILFVEKSAIETPKSLKICVKPKTNIRIAITPKSLLSRNLVKTHKTSILILCRLIYLFKEIDIQIPFTNVRQGFFTYWEDPNPATPA